MVSTTSSLARCSTRASPSRSACQSHSSVEEQRCVQGGRGGWCRGHRWPAGFGVTGMHPRRWRPPSRAPVISSRTMEDKILQDNMARRPTISPSSSPRDLQNDFASWRVASGRGGAKAVHVSAIVPRARIAADAVRSAGGVVIGTIFTLVPGRDGKAADRAAPEEDASFPRQRDFHSGRWGQGDGRRDRAVRCDGREDRLHQVLSTRLE